MESCTQKNSLSDLVQGNNSIHLDMSLQRLTETHPNNAMQNCKYIPVKTLSSPMNCGQIEANLA